MGNSTDNCDNSSGSTDDCQGTGDCKGSMETADFPGSGVEVLSPWVGKCTRESERQRAIKIRSIKEQVAAGTYKVDSTKVAESILGVISEEISIGSVEN